MSVHAVVCRCMIVIRVVEDADAKSVNSLSSEAVHLAGKGKCDMKRMMVAGGGMGNGNAYAVVEILYKDEQMEEVDSVWYKEFGDNPISKRIGNEVEWGRI